MGKILESSALPLVASYGLTFLAGLTFGASGVAVASGNNQDIEVPVAPVSDYSITADFNQEVDRVFVTAAPSSAAYTGIDLADWDFDSAPITVKDAIILAQNINTAGHSWAETNIVCFNDGEIVHTQTFECD